MPTLGEIIKGARERKRWSQQKLADAVGVSRASVGLWENDITAPKRTLMPKVAKALDLPLGAIDHRQAHSVQYLDTATHGRTIPIIPWEGITMLRGKSRGDEGVISVDSELPDDAVAMRVIDDAMEPEIATGELIVVSRSTLPVANDIVVAQVSGGKPLLRRYVPRGNDRVGGQVFDLLSTSPDWPTITCNSANDGKVLGVVLRHIRRLRRP